MNESFSFSQFKNYFHDDDACLEEIKKMRFPKGIYCTRCKKITAHYKLTGRLAYSCKYCRKQVYPLKGTIFEKTTTPLTIWFYAIFLMTHTKADISVKRLQSELDVTYKTSWRIATSIRKLMAQNKGDLLAGDIEYVNDDNERKGKKIEHKWVFFNKIELKVVQKHTSS